jgi:diaminohydroxyphosphoribosylaminopyrimidine deaminase / 5-amino-6-(5-phosphoribosylamino)uracil reductase
MDRFMERAIRLARKADPYPNPRVGAVLVKDGKIIGEGFHLRPGMPHAEIEAIEDARRRSGDRGAVRGAVLYVTLEPCSHTLKRTPPCTDAIIAVGIKKVVYGMGDPNPLVKGAAILKKAGVVVEGPVAEKEARGMNKEYISGLATKPLVTIKMAMSADGKTATRTGDSKHRISGPEEMRFVHRMRNEYDVVMVGAGTVIVDDPKLTCRIEGGRDPIRVVVDGKLRIPMDADVLRRDDGKTIIATSELAPKSKIEGIALSTSAHVFVCGRKEVDLRALTEALGGMGVRKIMIEGGSELNAKALEAGIVDRLYFVVSPKIIGGREAKGVVGGLGVAKVSEAVQLRLVKTKRLGDDLLLEFEVSR